MLVPSLGAHRNSPKWAPLCITPLRTWWCQLCFLIVHCCLCLSPRPSCAINRSYVGKLVVAYQWSAVDSTEPWPTVCTGFLCPLHYPLWYDLYSVDSTLKPQINKSCAIKVFNEFMSSAVFHSSINSIKYVMISVSTLMYLLVTVIKLLFSCIHVIWNRQ